MKKSNISGWKDVFSFTFIQTFKSKAFLISYVILLVLAAVSMPAISLINSSKDPNAASPVQKVYVDNKTTLPDMDFSELKNNKAMSGISFEVMKEDYDVVSDRVEKNEHDSVILTITENKGLYSLAFVKSSKGPIKSQDMHILGDAVTKQFDIFKINTLGITSEQADMLHAKVDTKVSMLDVSGVPIVKEDTSISNSEYWFIYGLLFVVMMVNIMASTQIATSIVTEKSTRVIEYLLTSIKPLALMIGKIIAMLTAVLIQMLSLVVVLFVSNKVSASISGNGNDVISKYLPSNIFENINAVNILFCIISILLGMIFYATLAGLAGATVSKLEEMQEGLTVFTFTNLIGAYIGIAAANILMGAGDNGFVTFAFLFPLSSPFILPGSILIGKVSAPMIAGAIVLQIVFIALLFKFVAKVFETLILHSGNTLKIKDVIKISKTV